MARTHHKRTERLARRRLFTRLLILSFIFISIGLVFISRTSNDRFAPLRSGVEDSAGRMISAVSFPLRKIKDFGVGVENLRLAKQQNDALRSENVELKQYKFRHRALQAKLERLEGVLSVTNGLDIPQDRVAVRLISETRGPFVYSVLINAGRKAGMQIGYPVMSDDAMIGHIIRVGERSSRVLLLQDLNSRVSVMSQESDARAILIGKNDEPPELAFFDDLSDWKDNDLIVTSGDDGILPQGLPIGRVRSDNIAPRVLLVPKKPHDWAWVYPFMAVQTPEQDPALSNEDGSLVKETGKER